MNTSGNGPATQSASAVRAWVDGRKVWIELSDGREIGFPVDKYRRLRDANDEQLEKVKIEAPRGCKRQDLSSTRDQEASYTKKRDRTHHGFKTHIATDVQGLIKDYRFTTAKVHDSQCMDELITKEKKDVFADRACMDRNRKTRLQNRGV